MANDLLPLDTLGATIRAHVSKGDASIEKAEQHFKAAGIHLMEAKERVKRRADMTWPAFLNAHCHIRRSRADEMIAIAEGKTSLSELRSNNRRRDSERREKNREARIFAEAHGKSAEKNQQIQQITTSQTVSEPHEERSRLLSEIRARLDRQEISVLHAILALL